MLVLFYYDISFCFAGMPHKGRGIRSRYRADDLEKAADAVRGGLSVRAASLRFGVPKSTLHDRVSGRIQPGAIYGKAPVLPQKTEEMMATQVKKAAAEGFGITRLKLMAKAGQVARKLSLSTPFTNGIPGRAWYDGFMKRNNNLSLRKPVPLTSSRSKCLNPTITHNYYKDLGEIISNLGLNNEAECIWNMDETNVQMLHHPVKVVAERGVRNIPGRVSDSKESISVVACINAAGQEVPPLCIVRGKTERVLRAYNTSEGVFKARYTFQEKAWMEDVLGEIWFKDQFLPHCGAHRPQLLLLDSHSSHETLGIIEAAKENNIHLMTFPPHSTHWLCPLDKTIFSPLQKAYDHTCSIFMNSSPNNIVCKWEWPRLFRKAHDKTFTKWNIRSGFKACGIHPFNPSAIPSSAYAPSVPYELQQTPIHTPSSNAIYPANLHPLSSPSNLHPLSSPSPLLPLSSLVNHPQMQTLTVN